MIKEYIIEYLPVIVSAIISGVLAGVVAAIKKAVTHISDTKDKLIEEYKEKSNDLVNNLYEADKTNKELIEKVTNLTNIVAQQQEDIQKFAELREAMIELSIENKDLKIKLMESKND